MHDIDIYHNAYTLYISKIWRHKMAKPVELGLVLEGEDAKRFWEDRKNPKVTKEQIDMFKEARQIYKTNFKA